MDMDITVEMKMNPRMNIDMETGMELNIKSYMRRIYGLISRRVEGEFKIRKIDIRFGFLNGSSESKEESMGRVARVSFVGRGAWEGESVLRCID
jgi:hypothetical protein